MIQIFHLLLDTPQCTIFCALASVDLHIKPHLLQKETPVLRAESCTNPQLYTQVFRKQIDAIYIVYLAEQW